MRPLIHKFTKTLVVLAATCLTSFSAPAVTVTYFHNDNAGTPLVATDASGNVLWKENYRPYGDKLNNQPASTNNSLWFTGKPYDSATGLSYMGARYYDPVLGRFTGVDPKGFDPGNIHSFNRYTYANNNPYKFVDPDGRSPLDVAFLVYDLAKLGSAVASGTGVAEAAANAALSAVGVASPIPGVGQALKIARAAERGVEAFKVTERATEVARTTERAAEAAGGVKKGLPNAGTGRGSVPPSERDPQRFFSDKQGRKKYEENGGRCDHCGEQKDYSQLDKHHIERHANGGKSNDENLGLVCKSDCHKEVHKRIEKD